MTEITPDDTRPKFDLALAHRYSLDERRFRTTLRSYAPLLRWGFDEKELAARGLDKPTSVRYLKSFLVSQADTFDAAE